MILIVCRLKGALSHTLFFNDLLIRQNMSLKKLRTPSQFLIETLAENIRRLRNAQNLSQEKLADICGLHRTYVGSVERGERNVTLSSLELLANALDVPIIELLKQNEK